MYAEQNYYNEFFLCILDFKFKGKLIKFKNKISNSHPLVHNMI